MDDLVDYLRISALNVEHMRTISAFEKDGTKHHGELPNAASEDGKSPSAAEEPKSHHFMRPKMSVVLLVPHLGRGR